MSPGARNSTLEESEDGGRGKNHILGTTIFEQGRRRKEKRRNEERDGGKTEKREKKACMKNIQDKITTGTVGENETETGREKKKTKG